MPDSDCINLDDYSVDPADLEALVPYLCRRDAMLGAYAIGKAAAMRYRLAGQVEHALRIERQLDRIYDQLPAELRW